MSSIDPRETKYDLYKKWILNIKAKGKAWSDITFACKGDEQGLKTFLKNKADEDMWDPITVEEWMAVVDYIQQINADNKIGFIHDPKKAPISPSDKPNSCWQLYKKKLKDEKHFTEASIMAIEEAGKRVLSQIDLTTPKTDPVRGMVMGNVQSGKTANMAAVISMAADYGYNFFIVLSGTIENLRDQTQKRLIADLSNDQETIHFHLLEHLSGATKHPDRLQDLSLDDVDAAAFKSTHRYLCVCLKNSTRLKDLLVWLNADEAKKSKLRILLLDDEADQAGINTRDIDKKLATAINRYIKDIVFCKDKNENPRMPYGSMNYIGYTATPYGNLLNVAREDELYPKNFVLCLPTPSEYIGPQQIFGLVDVNPGLPIVNTISTDEIVNISKTISFGYADVPPALKDALLWFVCALAIGRYWKKKRAFTMLIHTSQRVLLHEQMADSIQQFFNDLKKRDYLSDLKSVYNEQTQHLTLKDFLETMSGYNEPEKIKQYPDFEALEPFLKELVESGLTHILLNDDGSNFEFSKKIHLCIDNCKQNALSEDEVMMRIVYPEKEQLEAMETAPGFIVVGGATLSRGLTLEGLVCSYFWRTTTMADTLMQMGRWFGYRHGYELLPRIWLSQQTRDQFTRLSLLDYNLRHEIDVMSDRGLSPKDVGPKIDSFPDYKQLIITNAKKMQKAQSVEVAFGNKSGQTTKFFEDPSINHSNRQAAISFINDLGPLDLEAIGNLHNPNIDMSNPDNIWFDVDYKAVFDFLAKLNFPAQVATLGDIKKVEEWFKAEFEKGHLKNWDIILSSNDKGKIMDCFANGISIHMPTRTRENPEKQGKQPDPQKFDVRAITSPRDMLLDICADGLDPDYLDALQIKNVSKLNKLLGVKNASMAQKRIAFRKMDTPLLILYFIDKDSGIKDPKCFPTDGTIPERLPLNTPEDLFGYYVYIPYGVGDDGETQILSNTKVTVKLEFDNNEVDNYEENVD